MELTYKCYSFLYNTAKILLRRSQTTNDIKGISKKLKLGVSSQESSVLWNQFIDNSIIEEKQFRGNHYAGYLADASIWVLPSWIWTNAAIIRCFCKIGKLEQAKKLGILLSNEQKECGGWIVRNDYDNKGAIPVLAPNDSAYIANNAFLTLYEMTKDEYYLNIARKCADWIIRTARPDGMVYIGYNIRDERWETNCVIVDVGFTGGLFANLYSYTKDEKYKTFLKKFTDCYINLFFNENKHGFSTSIDKSNHQQGGMFGRGQAWALEGLIPAYQILKDEKIKNVIEMTIDNLLSVQCKDGGWPYNLTRPLMGKDCKAVSVIAKSMMDWINCIGYEKNKVIISNCAERALEWCRKHTSVEGETIGVEISSQDFLYTNPQVSDTEFLKLFDLKEE